MTKKIYHTHDNGGRPFRVEINGKDVSVFMNMDTYEKVNGKFQEVSRPEKHLFDFVAEEVMIGRKSPKGGYDGLKPKEAEGNSILLKVGSKYIFIGESIYEFKPLKGDTLQKFYSDIGNSDVPYPYAIGGNNVYILLEDHVAVEKSFFDMKKPIYEQYYEASSYLPLCLKGSQPSYECKDRAAAKARISELKEKQHKFPVKVLQKRKW
jgi:hypothetical protein